MWRSGKFGEVKTIGAATTDYLHYQLLRASQNLSEKQAALSDRETDTDA